MNAVDELCLNIRANHRERCFAMGMRKRADLAMGAFLRLELGWSPDLPKDQASSIRKSASDLLCGKLVDERFDLIVSAHHASIEPMCRIEKGATKSMKSCAKELPVWGRFGAAITGFGEIGLAIIVGEAGNLSNYPKKGHLWKRLGIACLGGVAQGKLGGKATAQEWIAHGYNPLRRARIFTIGDSLIKKENPYREIYLARKVYEKERAQDLGLVVLPAAKINTKNENATMSMGHVHRRAQRYMEQRLIRDLWREWRASA